MKAQIKISTVIKQGLALYVSCIVIGCSAHSPAIVQDTTDANMISSKQYSAHNDKVFLTKQSLPLNAQYEIIALIEVGKVWYGAADSVYESMAIRARELGADAVVEIKTWHQPSGFSWAAPHGSGNAVKLIDKGIISEMEGQWK